jgi:hypothetical protein
MLKNFFFNNESFKFFQSGMYLDFFFKKLIEVFVVNYLVLTSLFFGEKFLIEYITKKIIDNLLFNVNSIFFLFDLFFSKIFIFVFFVLLILLASFFLFFIF